MTGDFIGLVFKKRLFALLLKHMFFILIFYNKMFRLEILHNKIA